MPTETTTTETTETTERTRATDVLARYGDNVVRMAEKVADLESDLYKTRRSRDDYKREIEDIKQRLPAEGSVVLAKDDAALLDAYRALGTPADLTTRLTAADDATRERDTLKREKAIRQVADATGLKSDALAAIDQLYGGLTYEVKPVKEQVNGKQVEAQRAFVKREDKEVALVELVKQDYPALMATLDVTPAEIAPPPPGNPRGPRPATGPTDQEQEHARSGQSVLYRGF